MSTGALNEFVQGVQTLRPTADDGLLAAGFFRRLPLTGSTRLVESVDSWGRDSEVISWQVVAQTAFCAGGEVVAAALEEGDHAVAVGALAVVALRSHPLDSCIEVLHESRLPPGASAGRQYHRSRRRK